MLASLVQTGFLTWAFYASQPYLLDLLDSDAIWIAGLVASAIALSTITGNQLVQVLSRRCGRRTTLLIGAAVVETCAAVVLGLAGSFWVALPALLFVTASIGVTSPVRQAYLHQVVPSEQRATVVSFDSLVANAGGVGGQLGPRGARRGAWRGHGLRRRWTRHGSGDPDWSHACGHSAGRPTGSSASDAGVESPCAASGLPDVVAVETEAVA